MPFSCLITLRAAFAAARLCHDARWCRHCRQRLRLIFSLFTFDMSFQPLRRHFIVDAAISDYAFRHCMNVMLKNSIPATFSLLMPYYTQYIVADMLSLLPCWCWFSLLSCIRWVSRFRCCFRAACAMLISLSPYAAYYAAADVSHIIFFTPLPLSAFSFTCLLAIFSPSLPRVISYHTSHWIIRIMPSLIIIQWHTHYHHVTHITSLYHRILPPQSRYIYFLLFATLSLCLFSLDFDVFSLLSLLLRCFR